MSLSERLQQISHIVHSGHGFQVLRGLEPSKYSREDNIIAYAGITTHVAEKRTFMSKSRGWPLSFEAECKTDRKTGQAYNRVLTGPEERVPPNLLGGPMVRICLMLFPNDR